MPDSASAPIIVVGAGLAGLAAAVRLGRAKRPVLVLEATDEVGGRVKSDVHPDGFILDRGFQVLFTDYPAARHYFDYRTLGLRAFDAGVLLANGAAMQVVVDPFAHPDQLGRALGGSPLSFADDRRLLRLKLELMGPSFRRINAAPERTAAEELERLGFSAATRERLFEPLGGALFLDRRLQVRAAWFLFILKMLSEGRAVLPTAGMGTLGMQLASRLPAHSVRVRTPVAGLRTSPAGRVDGVQAGGQTIPARAVILATDAWSAAPLRPQTPDVRPLGCTTIYFAGDRPLYTERKIVLNADADGFLAYCAQVTNVAPSYAPTGQHLLGCVTIGADALSDAVLEERSRRELEAWFGTGARRLRRLAIYRLPRAQFAQPPGWHKHRPGTRTETPGLYLAGDYTQSSSIHGALQSGDVAARMLLEDEERGEK